MNVLSLFIYPVKSLRGIELTTMALDDFGPAGDRRWMIIDDEGQFVTQRTHPRLATLATTMVEGRVCTEIPSHGFHVLEAGDVARPVRVWRDRVQAREDAGTASNALSELMGEPLSFVYMPEATFREVDRNWVTRRRRVGFADGFPFLIVNQASLEDLNRRLERSVDVRRFRPNLVIQGGQAWQEDRWQRLRVGKVEFDLVKPSSRCVTITVDPERGTKASDVQPLRTLGRFRRTQNGVTFGINALHRPGGDSGDLVEKGDHVEILQLESSGRQAP